MSNTKIMTNKEYANYLRGRSLLGLIYRNVYLYPRLASWFVGRTLDVGCGVGDMLAYCKGAVGVDINSFNIDFCIRRGLNARQMEIDLLPFSDNSFDTVVLDNVLEHIPDPIPILNEIQRVLDANGRLVVGVPGLKGYASDPDHKVFYDEDGLDRLAKKSGFRVTHYSYTPMMKSDILSKNIRQYCIYSFWTPLAVSSVAK